MKTYAIISSLANALTAAIVGAMICRRARKSPLHTTYVLACTSVVVWSAGYFLWQLASTKSEALFYCRLLMVGAILIPTFYLHHIVILLNQKKTALLRVSYGGALVFLVADVTPWFVANVRRKYMFEFWPDAGWLFGPFLLWFFGIALYKLLLIQKAFRSSVGSRRNQIFYVFIGTFIAYAGGITNFALWYDWPIFPVGNGCVSIYLALTSYAILRHRLMDINVIIRKTLVYSVVTGSLTIIYLGVIALFARVFQGLTGYQTIFSSAVAAGLITVGFQPLRKRTQAFVDGKFFREYVDREEKLYELSREVITHTTPEAMGEALMRVLGETLHPKTAALYLRSRFGNEFVRMAFRGEGQAALIMSGDNALAGYFSDHPQPFVRDVPASIGESHDTRQPPPRTKETA